MSVSYHELDQVIVFDFLSDKASWMTPSEAKRYCSAHPTAEIIEERHADWKYFAKLAGPKPKRHVKYEEHERPAE